MKAVLKTQKKVVSSKGGNLPGPGPGRPKGLKNKFTINVKDAFLETFDGLGGAAGLLSWAKKSPKNQGIFYSWISRMLPAGAMIDKTPDAESIETALNNIAAAMKP